MNDRFKIRLGCVLMPLLTGSLISSLQAQPSPDRWQQNVDSARVLQSEGRIDAAIALYRDAVELSPTPAQRAEIYLELGLLSNRKGTDEADLRESANFFREALGSGDGDLRLKAASNYAAQLVRLGEPAQASDVLGGVLSEFRDAELDPVARSRLLFNYASALENDGRVAEARGYFAEAYSADPSFSPSRDALARLALESPSEATGIPDLIRLTSDLIERSDFEAAVRYVNAGLTIDHWIGHSEYPRLVTQFAAVYTAAKVSPEQFREQWSDRWTDLLSKVSPARDARRLADAYDAYLGELSVVVNPDAARGEYSAWAPEERATLSALLKMIGDHYFRGGSNGSALARYARAWAVDTTNMDAGLYLANLLTADAEFARYSDEFLFHAFDEKMQAYLGEDWASILKFHTILGTFFERREVWGPDTVARTASFQWKHALQAHTKLAEEGSEPSRPVPDLRERLARAYENSGRRELAVEHYLGAAEEYAALRRDEDAVRARTSASRIR